MISELFHRRRAERLARLLDQADGGPRRHSRSSMDDRLVSELAIVQRLTTVEFAPRVEPRAEFRARLRANLVATTERQPVAPAQRRPVSPVTGRIYADASPGSVASRARTGTATTPAPSTVNGNRPAKRRTPGTRRTRVAILAGVAAGTLALSGISVASGDAMPGDPLYAMKRSTESAQLVLAGSDVDRGQAYLSFARTRAREAAVTRANPGKLIPVLSDLDEQTTSGVRLLTAAALSHRDAGLLDPVDAFVADQRPVLTDLLGTVSTRDRPRAQQSLDLLTQITQRSTALRAAISCTPVGRSDALGPLPPDCTRH
jgi:Domain of unknown function (DUF5667)